MVVTHSDNTQEKWQAENLYGFQKTNKKLVEISQNVTTPFTTTCDL